MKTKNIFKYLTITLVAGVLISSCRKEEDKDNDTSSAGDNALAEGAFNDVNNIADQAATGSLATYLNPMNSAERSMLSTCATITNDTTVSPHILTVDFGASNCMCTDGRNRRGKIIVSYSGLYRDSASVHSFTFNNYFVNDNQILGTKTVTNNGHNAAGHLVYAVQVNGQIIKANGGGTITWNSTRQREWIVGESTLIWADDSYLITGSASGTSAAGTNFTAVITQALRKDIGCRHIVSGQIELTPDSKPTRYINFGTGGCDNDATVTINGNVYNVNLP